MNNIKLAMEVPIAHLEDLKPYIDIHFVIASYLQKYSSYRDYYFSKRDKGDFIMLDNGMFEEGEPLGCEALFHIAWVLKPHIVFAPDQHPYMNKTLELSFQFLELCKERKVPWTTALIPQGETPEEVIQCLKEMQTWEYSWTYRIPELRVIGLSFLNDRPKVIELMLKENLFQPKTIYHMLGLYSLNEIKDWPRYIDSMDTVKPIKAAYQNERIENMTRGQGKWKADWILNEDQKALMIENVKTLKDALRRI